MQIARILYIDENDVILGTSNSKKPSRTMPNPTELIAPAATVTKKEFRSVFVRGISSSYTGIARDKIQSLKEKIMSLLHAR